MQKNEINDSQDIFLELLNYCNKTGLVFWFEEKMIHYRLYISDNLHFEEQKKNGHYFCSKINIQFIEEKKLNLRFSPSDQDATCNVELWNPWRLKDTHDNDYQLFFHCFSKCNSEFVTKHLFKPFLTREKEEFNFSKIFNYGSFFDGQHFKKNEWNKFNKFISPNILESFWNNSENIQNLQNNLHFANKNDLKYFIDSISNVNYLKETNDCSFNFAKLIVKQFKNEPLILEHYGSKHPWINELINNQSIFQPPEKNHYIIEKTILNKADLLFHYPIENSEIWQYNKLISDICDNIKNNTHIKKSGLMEFNYSQSQDGKQIIFYLTIEENHPFNKKHFENIFINGIENIINFNKKEVFNEEQIKKIINTNIECWHLEQQYPEKNNNKNKLKI